jgi:hypothetical protein
MNRRSLFRTLLAAPLVAIAACNQSPVGFAYIESQLEPIDPMLACGMDATEIAQAQTGNQKALWSTLDWTPWPHSHV